MERMDYDIETILNTKHHFIMYSGGADSLYILDLIAKLSKDDESNIKTINTIEIDNHTNFGSSLELAQRHYRDKAIKVIEERYDIGINRVSVNSQHNCAFSEKSGDCGQSIDDIFAGHFPIMIAAILNCQCAICDNDKSSMIHVGFNASDGNSLSKCMVMRKSVEDIFFITYHYKIKINFPLWECIKRQILKWLKKDGLIEYAWSCEFPIIESDELDKNYTFKPCGHCISCVDGLSVELDKDYEPYDVIDQPLVATPIGKSCDKINNEE